MISRRRFGVELEIAETTGGSVAVELTEHELSELVELLRALIRIRSVNPPGDEILVARYLEQIFAAEGVPATIVEPFPGRGSIIARLRGDGTGGESLLLLSHLDVVPAEPAGWTHDPFGGDLEDGYVWGRGAMDMKGMVAMEVQVMRRLARATRAAGLDPATDVVPGLRRDIIFCSTADEEAGGRHGAGWIVDNHPEWLHAAAALNEAGGISTTYAGVRIYPIQVAEKGFAVYKLHVKGRWGHGSVPTPDNAAVIAAQVVTRLAEPGPARLTEAMAAALAQAGPHLPAPARAAVAGLGSADSTRVEATLHQLCDPFLARTISSVIRDTISVGIVSAGVKYNVIPGTAEIVIDCRTLPGTDEPAMRAELRRRIGEDLMPRVEIELEQVGSAVQAPLDSPLYRLLEQAITEADPDGVPVPFMAPFATDAKHLARIGVPAYGFSPLQVGPHDGLLELMHADDERVGVEALRFGLTTLWQAVTRFCS
jgi:acetylornithine deacetylase/succinyl-diaminopimelate desuccinylase-like protein